MAADRCRICAAVARGGRIRITEDSGALMIALLTVARRESLRARRAAITGAADAEKHEADLTIKTIDVQIEEIERTQAEMGWRNGQHQRTHP